MEMLHRNNQSGVCTVRRNGVEVSFNYLRWVNGYRLTKDSAKRAAELCIFQRLEATLNGSTEYLEEEKEEEKPSDQYIEMEKARDTLNRWLEINK
jgi:hypothetical protein